MIIQRLQSTPFRLLYAVVWTVFITVILTQSSSEPIIGPARPSGPRTVEGELLLTVGHLIAFGSLTLMWYWALEEQAIQRTAIILLITLPLGIGTELYQMNIPDREPSLYDVSMNNLAVFATLLAVSRFRQRN